MAHATFPKRAVKIPDDADLDDIIDGIEYPSSDGKPMVESEIHLIAIILLYQILRRHYYKDRTDVYVIANMMLYWEIGNPKACGSPDVMVCFGVKGIHLRRSFVTWKEGVIPSVAFEIASPKTWRKRLGKSKDDYERAGIKEYFIFDPEKKYIPEHLLGFRLKGKRYVRINPNKDGSMLSREMNLLLVPHGRDLRVADPTTRVWFLTETEEAEREAARADSLQVEVERLRALLDQRNGHGNGKRNGSHSS